jgi:hypothetical protein
MGDIADRLERGEFDPGLFRRFLLRAASHFGGTEYDTAVKELRLSHVLPELSDENKESVLTGLAEATLSCEPDEIEGVCQVMYDLLGENLDMRRDFFVNKLFLPCTSETMNATSAAEIDQGKLKKLDLLNKFFENKGICLSEVETVHRQLENLISRELWNAVVADDADRPAHISLLKVLVKFHAELKEDLLVNCLCAENSAFNAFLGCFGKDREEQIANFDEMVNEVKRLGQETFSSSPECRTNKDKLEASLRPKIRDLLLENPTLIWPALALYETFKAKNPISLAVFPRLIKYGGATFFPEFWCAITDPIFLQNIKSTDQNYTNDQVRLLCCGANLGELLKKPMKNAEDINIFLKFIQDKALVGENPLVTPDDILPGADAATWAKLSKFVSDRPANYDQKLVDFIKNGAQPKIKEEVEFIFEKNRLFSFQVLLTSCDEATITYLHDAFGDKLKAVMKDVVKDGIKRYIREYNSFFAGETTSPSLANGALENLQNYLGACRISAPNAIDEEGVFGFAINGTLDDLGISRETYLALPFKVLTKADSPLTPAPNPAPSSLSPT